MRQNQNPGQASLDQGLEPRAFLDEHGEYVGAYTTYVIADTPTLLYLTGILNARLTNFVFRCLYDALAMGSGYLRFQPPQVRRIPIRVLDLADKSQRQQHEQMTQLVTQMLKLNRRAQSIKTAHERTAVERQIAATEREIDALVYELYGLSDEEIRLVEEATEQ